MGQAAATCCCAAKDDGVEVTAYAATWARESEENEAGRDIYII